MQELKDKDLVDLLSPSLTKVSKASPPGELEIASFDEAHDIMLKALENKKMKAGLTRMNAACGVFHVILTVCIEREGLVSSIKFFDLRGPERVAASGSHKSQGALEALGINQSLSALTDVITSLASKKTHIPFHNHQLTLTMKDSFLNGNCTMLLTLCPGDKLDPFLRLANSMKCIY